MDNLQYILSKEETISNQIYLYKIDDFWVAFERSAFYLFSLCKVDYMFQHTYGKETYLFVVIKDCYSINNPQLKQQSLSEGKIIFQSSIICKGFEAWKHSLLPLLTKSMNYTMLSIPQQMHLQ